MVMFLPSRGLVDVRLVTLRERALSQVSLVCQSVQRRTWPTVADTASNVKIIGLAVAGNVSIACEKQKKASDEISEAQMHRVADWKRGRRRVDCQKSAERCPNQMPELVVWLSGNAQSVTCRAFYRMPVYHREAAAVMAPRSARPWARWRRPRRPAADQPEKTPVRYTAACTPSSKCHKVSTCLQIQRLRVVDSSASMGAVGISCTPCTPCRTVITLATAR
jgi:hypothetical protein